MRTFTPFVNEDVARLLDVLADKSSTPQAYQGAMSGLGQVLADRIADQLQANKRQLVYIACTVEDADFLARGLLEELASRGLDQTTLRLACFWNERVKHFNESSAKAFDVAPVRKQYREPGDLQDAIVVVVKSIISGACVVKTNLAALLEDVTPSRVFVAAPVMLQGADKRLSSEFSDEVASRFEYVTFAIDTERDDDENVVPGIGGSVYERLGFDDKNSHVPNIVKERRKQLMAANG